MIMTSIRDSKKKNLKKNFRPTYPNFWGHVTGNTHTFLFGLIAFCYLPIAFCWLLIENSPFPWYNLSFASMSVGEGITSNFIYGKIVAHFNVWMRT